MKVLVNTCVWWKVLRRKTPDISLANRLKDLIKDGRVAIIGPIRQEILSGISDERQFKKLEKQLAAFEDIPLQSEYFVEAARFSNLCRKKGIQGSTIDFLICAVATSLKMSILTTDQDFKIFSKYLNIVLS